MGDRGRNRRPETSCHYGSILWRLRDAGGSDIYAAPVLLRGRSPLHRAGSISKPLLIGHGANDIRVKQAESEQIVAAMTDNRLPVTYLLYPDEGHGLERPQNRLSWYAIAETFLMSHLGGRSEPIGADLAGACLDVREGAAHVPGLAEAIDVAGGVGRGLTRAND